MSTKRFFKNTKKNKKYNEGRNQSPSNFRTITESFKFSFPKIDSVPLLKIYRGSLKVFIALIFLLAAFVVGLDLDSNLREKQSIDSEREKLTRELRFWQEFINGHQNYRDAYFQASLLEYKIGNTSKAKILVEKGLALDPNSEEGRKIEVLLEDK